MTDDELTDLEFAVRATGMLGEAKALDLIAEVRRLRTELDAMELEHQCCTGAELVEQTKRQGTK